MRAIEHAVSVQFRAIPHKSNGELRSASPFAQFRTDASHDVLVVRLLTVRFRDVSGHGATNVGIRAPAQLRVLLFKRVAAIA